MSDDLRFDQLLREDASGLPPAMADVNPWCEAMWLVLWGMGLTTITFHFLYLDLLLPALGGILMVLGFRTLRQENKALRWCWRLSIVIAAVRSASFVLEALPVDVKYVPAYAVMVMTFALYIGLWWVCPAPPVRKSPPRLPPVRWWFSMWRWARWPF